jgi:hypothetical protein
LNLDQFENNLYEFYYKHNKVNPLKAQADIVLYHYLISYLVSIIRDMGVEPLTVHIPTQTEALKMVEY